MLHALNTDAIASAPTSRLDALSAEIWQAHGAGRLDDDQATALAEAIQARRNAAREEQTPGVSLGAALLTGASGAIVRRSIFPPKRLQRSPDKQASRERRRLVARSGPMPPQIAARFTEGQVAVLGVIATEIAKAGLCALSVAEIAARAGVCRRLAQSAIRLAEGDELLRVQERPQRGRKHQTNLIRVSSREWSAWLLRRRPPGCKAIRPTNIPENNPLESTETVAVGPIEHHADTALKRGAPSSARRHERLSHSFTTR